MLSGDECYGEKRAEVWGECCHFIMSGQERLSDKVIFLQKCQESVEISIAYLGGESSVQKE